MLRSLVGSEMCIRDSNGASQVVTLEERDVLQAGFGLPAETADAVFLDLPSPWRAIASARAALKPGGRLCNFSPCIEQVQQACVEMEKQSFHDIRTYEILVRSFEVQRMELEVGKSNKRKRQEQMKNKQELRSGGQPSQGKLVTKPFIEMKGHTGFLSFARLLND
eukprot:TRINITY_DN56145_c0_g1_i2.p1 TRINITY_DN56145_c0_g1~~TRINITY_DN56145_c0_g1_i2.p1  ORF type:complete len:165 (-),score=39.22 TRINITY_DN56145_c0_g1_i2:211-705(-)